MNKFYREDCEFYEDQFVFNMFQISKNLKKNDLEKISFRKTTSLLKGRSKKTNLKIYLLLFEETKKVYNKFFHNDYECPRIFIFPPDKYHPIPRISYYANEEGDFIDYFNPKMGLYYNSISASDIDTIARRTKLDYQDLMDLEINKRYHLNHNCDCMDYPFEE